MTLVTEQILSARHVAKAAAILSRRRITYILGIETSCDDTSVAVVDDKRRVLAQRTRHQNALHEPYGGVVPRQAGLAHAAALPELVREVLAGARSVDPESRIDAVAATRGPGLTVCLSVGFNAATVLAAALGKPFYAVHHLEAHVLTPRLTETAGPQFPYLTLLVSGGNTMLVFARSVGDHVVLGATGDDAIGEAFDKVSRSLGLTWAPTSGGAGAALEACARGAIDRSPVQPNECANAKREEYNDRWVFTVPFTRVPVEAGRELEFSFSGIKSQARRYVEGAGGAQGLAADPRARAALAAAFQCAATAHLASRLKNALKFTRALKPTCVVLVGGVAANGFVHAQLDATCRDAGIAMVVPPASMCTDNAAMVAWVAHERQMAGHASDSTALGTVLGFWKLPQTV